MATKLCEIFTLLLSYVVPVKSKVKISQHFVAFSEYMNFTLESSSQVQSKTRRLVKFLLELIVKPLAAAFEIFNSVELTFEFRLHSKSHRLNCGHRARNKIKLRRTCILTRFMFLTEQKKLC